MWRRLALLTNFIEKPINIVSKIFYIRDINIIWQSTVKIMVVARGMVEYLNTRTNYDRSRM